MHETHIPSGFFRMIFTTRKFSRAEAVMTRVSPTTMHVIALVAALVLGWPAGARAYGGGTYIYVSKEVPQRIYLIEQGNIVFESPVNTGIRAAPIPDGDYRVFSSYPQHTMKGTDPVTGRPYHDANVPYVMYFDGGRAIHGFHRSGYGYPQSFGCVELPVYKARQLYDLLHGGLGMEVVVAYERPQVLYSKSDAEGAGRRGFGG